MVIITNKGLLYEYRSSGFDAKLKAVKRVAESNDETSMAKVSSLSIFDILIRKSINMFYLMALDNKR